MLWDTEDPVQRASELSLVRANEETVASHLRNALTVLRFTLPYDQSPRDVVNNLLAIESRLMQALMALEDVK